MTRIRYITLVLYVTWVSETSIFVRRFTRNQRSSRTSWWFAFRPVYQLVLYAHHVRFKWIRVCCTVCLVLFPSNIKLFIVVNLIINIALSSFFKPFFKIFFVLLQYTLKFLVLLIIRQVRWHWFFVSSDVSPFLKDGFRRFLILFNGLRIIIALDLHRHAHILRTVIWQVLI